MALNFRRTTNPRAHYWPLYQDGLLVSAIFLCLQNILTLGAPSFWSLAFLMGAHFYWRQSRNCFELVQDLPEFNFYFLAQASCLLAMSFESGNFSYLALMAIAILVGLRESKNTHMRTTMLLGALIGMALVMSLAQERIALQSFDVMLFLSLLVVGISPILGSTDSKAQYLNFDSERLFFHDLVGEIHGLGLYLSAQRLTREGRVDVNELERMVKSMGQMVRKHYQQEFGTSHRSLTASSEVVGFSDCMSELQFIVKSYLNGPNLTVHFTHLGLLENRSAWAHLTLHKTNFRRLMLNICKNIAESGSTQIEFLFKGSKEGLHFEVRNNLTGLSSVERDLDSHLGAVISSADLEAQTHSSDERGLGLLSMAQICESSGGSFHFHFESHCWITSGLLPWQSDHQADGVDDEDFTPKVA